MAADLESLVGVGGCVDNFAYALGFGGLVISYDVIGRGVTLTGFEVDFRAADVLRDACLGVRVV